MEAGELDRVKNMIEEEAEKREFGDTKTMEIAAKAEELCSRLGDELLSRLKDVESQMRSRVTGTSDNRMDELLAKQKIDFEILQKTIKGKLSTAIEEMQGTLSRALRGANKADASREFHKSVPTVEEKVYTPNLAESFGTRLERETSEEKPGDTMSPFRKAREDIKEGRTPEEGDNSDDSMILYRNYLKKRAQETGQTEEERPSKTEKMETKKMHATKKARSTSKPKKPAQSGTTYTNRNNA